MKTKILLIIIVLFIVNKTYSQTYEPIVDTTKMWVVYEHGMDPFGGRTYAYKFTDSLFIDGFYWHKLVKSEDVGYTQWTLNGYIREENKFVIYKYSSGGIDTIYNFNMAIGDTIGNTNLYYYIVDKYIDYFAGGNREVFDINSSCYPNNFKHYEGIGSTLGIISPLYYCITGGGRELVCYYENDSLLYHNSNYDSCYIDNTTNNINILQKNVFEIYPNPSTGNVQLTMSNEQLKNARIEIVTITGKTVYTSSLQGTKQSIDLSKQAKGIYIIKLIGEGFVSTQKVVLE